jgi:hypothetical protein
MIAAENRTEQIFADIDGKPVDGVASLKLRKLPI